LWSFDLKIKERREDVFIVTLISIIVFLVVFFAVKTNVEHQYDGGMMTRDVPEFTFFGESACKTNFWLKNGEESYSPPNEVRDRLLEEEWYVTGGRCHKYVLHSEYLLIAQLCGLISAILVTLLFVLVSIYVV